MDKLTTMTMGNYENMTNRQISDMTFCWELRQNPKECTLHDHSSMSTFGRNCTNEHFYYRKGMLGEF